MLIKSLVKLEDRNKYFSMLGGLAQLALVLGIVLGRMAILNPVINFISGVLIGFSFVGNLAYLIHIL